MMSNTQCLVSHINRSSLTFEEYNNILVLIQLLNHSYIKDKKSYTDHDFRITQWKYDSETDMVDIDYQEASAEDENLSWIDYNMKIERKLVNNPDCFNAYVKYQYAKEWVENDKKKNEHKNTPKILECKRKQLETLKNGNTDNCLKKAIKNLQGEIYGLQHGYDQYKQESEKNLKIVQLGFKITNTKWERQYQDLMKYCPKKEI